MRILFTFILLSVLSAGCRKTQDHDQLLKSLEKEIVSGNISRAIVLADSLKAVFSDKNEARMTADSLREIALRIKADFASSPEETFDAIAKKAGRVTPLDVETWEKLGWLDFRIIEGRKMYFNRAASNVILLMAFHGRKANCTSGEDEESAARKKHTAEVLKSSAGRGNPAEPKTIGIVYTITVAGDAVPENEIIRCWLPWPRRGYVRQRNIRLLASSSNDYMISPDSSVHSTLYMEKKAEKGSQTVFSIAYEYESSAQWFDPDVITTKPYDRNSELYREFTREQLPHINFSAEIRRLADSICENEEDPAGIVFSIWRWFKENIPWTGAIEYSIIPDITAYACRNRRGDCGIQTMMFMSMLRYKGIPVKWQSGWKVPPFGKNLHDWCEVYFEGAGWVPVDVSYDLQNSGDRNMREYFMSGIDSYRLIVNDGIAGELYPAKKYLRSEPYDFQRGEVEWKGGNLYFDRWDYEMKIEYR